MRKIKLQEKYDIQAAQMSAVTTFDQLLDLLEGKPIPPPPPPCIFPTKCKNYEKCAKNKLSCSVFNRYAQGKSTVYRKKVPNRAKFIELNQEL